MEQVPQQEEKKKTRQLLKMSYQPNPVIPNEEDIVIPDEKVDSDVPQEPPPERRQSKRRMTRKSKPPERLHYGVFDQYSRRRHILPHHVYAAELKDGDFQILDPEGNLKRVSKNTPLNKLTPASSKC